MSHLADRPNVGHLQCWSIHQASGITSDPEALPLIFLSYTACQHSWDGSRLPIATLVFIFSHNDFQRQEKRTISSYVIFIRSNWTLPRALQADPLPHILGAPWAYSGRLSKTMIHLLWSGPAFLDAYEKKRSKSIFFRKKW